MLVSLGLLVPALGLPQPVTGPVVNALLIIAVETTGVGAAMLVGMVTPLNALLAGVLPLPLMVMIPFIALGNALFVGIFGALRTRNYWLGVGVAAVAKFGLLYRDRYLAGCPADQRGPGGRRQTGGSAGRDRQHDAVAATGDCPGRRRTGLCRHCGPSPVAEVNRSLPKKMPWPAARAFVLNRLMAPRAIRRRLTQGTESR